MVTHTNTLKLRHPFLPAGALFTLNLCRFRKSIWFCSNRLVPNQHPHFRVAEFWFFYTISVYKGAGHVSKCQTQKSKAVVTTYTYMELSCNLSGWLDLDEKKGGSLTNFWSSSCSWCNQHQAILAVVPNIKSPENYILLSFLVKTWIKSLKIKSFTPLVLLEGLVRGSGASMPP